MLTPLSASQRQILHNRPVWSGALDLHERLAGLVAVDGDARATFGDEPRFGFESCPRDVA